MDVYAVRLDCSRITVGRLFTPVTVYVDGWTVNIAWRCRFIQLHHGCTLLLPTRLDVVPARYPALFSFPVTVTYVTTPRLRLRWVTFVTVDTLLRLPTYVLPVCSPIPHLLKLAPCTLVTPLLHTFTDDPGHGYVGGYRTTAIRLLFAVYKPARLFPRHIATDALVVFTTHRLRCCTPRCPLQFPDRWIVAFRGYGYVADFTVTVTDFHLDYGCYVYGLNICLPAGVVHLLHG